MSTYLDTPKIQALNRLTLCHAALHNLGVTIGDSVEVRFDEGLGCLLIKPAGKENKNNKRVAKDQSGLKAKK